MDEIGLTLREARESSGVSIKEASKDLDLSEPILENIEEGKIGAFKDVLELKNYITNYAKYLGLDEVKIVDDFNEYLFEYTSKIPVKELEKTIELQMKNTSKEEKVISPYTKKNKPSKWYFLILIVLIIFLVLGAVIWSVKQVTLDSKITSTISYRG